MILYIHGFASCGLGKKTHTLMMHYGTGKVLAPDLSHEPAIAIQQLETLLQQQPVELIFGSSLGGFYATWLNTRAKPIPAVLINPATANPHLLDDLLGGHTGCQGKFTITQTHIQQLLSYHRTTLSHAEAYTVLLATGDEILDYRLAAEFYAGKNVVIEQGGNHRFDNLAAYLPQIDRWRAGL